jgi:hypothetical protein
MRFRAGSSRLRHDDTLASSRRSRARRTDARDGVRNRNHPLSFATEVVIEVGAEADDGKCGECRLRFSISTAAGNARAKRHGL